MAHALWGGCFTEKPAASMQHYNKSIDFDKELWQADIQGSIAYANALLRAKMINEKENADIVKGLNEIAQEWEKGTFEIIDSDEDIHTAVERRLKALIGAAAGKLHTGRSRNDQVATDVRIWLSHQIDVVIKLLAGFIKVATDRAEREIEVLMPGYTHLQRAQPIRWSHWIMSHSTSLKRDIDRLVEAKKRVCMLPLGSGALAGNPFDVDRMAICKELGFEGITANSLDAVNDRDFIIEVMWIGSQVMLHLSKFAEDLINYSTKEFGFVQLSDKYSTGSSLMPQKKNPDSLELMRGKCGSAIGDLVKLLVITKGIPSTYNKDLQEDKIPLFELIGNVRASVEIATGVLDTLTIFPEKMRAALSYDMLATDIAYYLAREPHFVPFRTAHEHSGKCVAKAKEKNCELPDLTEADLKEIDQHFVKEEYNKIFNFENSVEQYQTPGGTSRKSVNEQIKNMRAAIHALEVELAKKPKL